MIIRPEQHWFLRLFDWHGSVLSKIIFRLLLNVLMSIIAIISYQWYEQLGIHLTVAPFSLLGIAIAIFLGFRNSASYSRFVEARNLWGTVLIAERTLVRQLRNILPAEHDVHRRIVSYLVAFSWSLKHQLRKTDPTADLRRLLPFALVGDLHYMTPFVSVFISYTFLSWDSLAEELEDPFGTAANDLPLNAMCNTIERNLLDMTGQHPLPETLRPDRYFNLT